MENVINIKDPKECCSARTVLWYLVFTGFAMNYMIRLNMNIALVSMIRPIVRNESLKSECDILDISISDLPQNKTRSIYYNRTIYTTTTISSSIKITDSFPCLTYIKNVTQFPLTNQLLPDSDRIYFDWNENEQGLILGSLFWLHWSTQIPGGILAAKYGTKKVFGWATFLGVAGNYLIPLCANQGISYLIFIRCLQGLIIGFCWPSMHSMAAKWIPPNERSKFVTAYIGSSVGAALTYPLCGFIIDKWGWEMVFYSNGVVGTIWFIVWCCFVYDSPSEHPRISQKEKMYILDSLGKSVSQKKLRIPWKAILTDRCVWLNGVAQIGNTWGVFILTVNGPSYFKFIHGWNIQATGLLSGMPHIFKISFALLLSTLADYLLRSNKMNRTNVRKFATLFSCGVQGIFTLALAYSGCNKIAAIFFMTLAISASGAVSTGPLASLVDISPNYSSILLGITNTLVSVVGFCTPAVVGYFTFQNVPANHEEWKNIERGFNSKWNFPGAYGAIDGKHVLIRAPPNFGNDFFNYNGTNSIILLAVVDDSYCFSYINVGASGRCSDGGEFENTYIFRELERNMLPDGGIFVGDDEFPLKPYLLKPYTHAPLTREQKIFNYRLSRVHRIVENAFGILVSRFRIFERPIGTDISVTDKIIRTSCVLHNWLRKTSNTYLTRDSVDCEDLESGEVIPGSWRTEILNGLASIRQTGGSNHSSRVAREKREKYTTYFSGEGAVPWQDRMIN